MSRPKQPIATRMNDNQTRPQISNRGRSDKRGQERRVPLLKAIQVIECLATSKQPDWGVRELARALEMSPSTVFRLLSMLEEASIVESEDGKARYSFTLDFHRLAYHIASKMPVRDLAGHHLRALAESTGEAVYLGRYDRRRQAFTYVEHLESAHPLRYEMRLYEWLDLRVGAGGMGVLAFLPEPEIESILSQAMPPEGTSRTITNVRELRAELSRIREQGYVLSIGRRIVGAVGIAAPVFDRRSRVVGVVVLALPESRLPKHDVSSLAAAVVQAARDVSNEHGDWHSSVADSPDVLSAW